jgi:hypothetical protein
MATPEKPPRYRAYLLRFWEERGVRPETSSVWRFSLEDSQTGERRGFSSLDTLVAFLRKELASGADGKSQD